MIWVALVMFFVVLGIGMLSWYAAGQIQEAEPYGLLMRVLSASVMAIVMLAFLQRLGALAFTGN